MAKSVRKRDENIPPSRLLELALTAGGEAAIIRMFMVAMLSEQVRIEGRIPLDPALDTVVYEMAFKFGRADIVAFHADGSASVIEAKDGTKGYAHVVSGIGQAGLYATQLALSKKTLTKVRKCLLWTSTGDADLDAAIECVCLTSGVVPLPWGTLAEHLDGVRKAFVNIKGLGDDS